MTDDSDLRVTPFSTHWGTYYAEVQGGKLGDIQSATLVRFLEE